MHRKYFLVALSILLLLLSACNDSVVKTASPVVPVPLDLNKPYSNSTTLPPLYPYSRTLPSSGTSTLHAIIVADTNNKTIGESVEKDIENMSDLLQSIKDNTGLQLKVQSIDGNQLTLDNVTNTVNDLSVGRDDVVIFYYSGHGLNLAKGSKWPSMLLDYELLELDWAITKLTDKKPRFFMVIADACNTFIEFLNRSSKSMGLLRPENYRELFLNYHGYIIASSSTPGQKSWGSNGIGGYFTHAFLNSLNENLAFSNPSWHTILEQAKKPIPTDDPEQPLQHPQTEINIERVLPVDGEEIEEVEEVVDDEDFGDNEVNEVEVNEPERPEYNVSISQQHPERETDDDQLSIQVLPSQQFRVAESMQIKVHNRSQEQGYLFVWDINNAGQLTRIFPNKYSQKKRQLPAGKTVMIPENAFAGFGLRIVEPVGQNFLVALLVKENLVQKVLRLENLSATNDQATLQQLREQLNKNLGQEDDWSIATVDYKITH
jgi:hypothetical protein